MLRQLKKLVDNDFSMIVLEDYGLEEYGKQGKTTRYALFQCRKCGKKIKLRTAQVKMNKTGKCRECRISEGNTIHGKYKDRLWLTWQAINRRCSDMNNIYYGGKGIANDFIDFNQFVEWSNMSGYKKELSIDRIDSNGNYSQSNCRWATKCVQARNTVALQRNNTSGYRGVTFVKKENKWNSNIKVDGKVRFLGSFESAEKAGEAFINYVVANNLEHNFK